MPLSNSKWNSLLQEILTYMQDSPHSSDLLREHTSYILRREIHEKLSSLFREAQLPLPPATNMGDVVNDLTANSTGLPDFYAMAENLIVQGAASPHFSTACAIVAQLWGGGRG